MWYPLPFTRAWELALFLWIVIDMHFDSQHVSSSTYISGFFSQMVISCHKYFLSEFTTSTWLCWLFDTLSGFIFSINHCVIFAYCFFTRQICLLTLSLILFFPQSPSPSRIIFHKHWLFSWVSFPFLDLRSRIIFCLMFYAHAWESIIMLLVNYENFANVVAENIIKTRCIQIQCVSFAINFDFIDLSICKYKRKDYKIKVFRVFHQNKICLVFISIFSYRSSLCILEYIIFLRCECNIHLYISNAVSWDN